MPQIQQLPAHIADLIAAGEVVERPASVCKELLENALDAGASAVSVELEKGGLTYLRVTDNGCGMAAEQLPTAFLRHATSKLRTASDLAAIHTLGFRGEALAAIAAVSRLDVFSREPSAEAGARLHLEGGVPGEVTAAGCPVGTTICVRDLFYNTPARMKFMKKDSAEGGAASAVVTQLALSHPDVSFKLLRDGQEVLHTPGNGELLPAVYAALGRDFALSLLPVSGSNGDVRVSGFVTKPLAGHGTRARQLFFVNGRLVKSQLLTAAVEEGYRNRLLKGKFPGCVLHITLPPEAVDVNVHPAKTVVKFVSDKTVFDAVYHTVTSALDEEGRPPKPAEKPFFQTMTAAEFRARPDAPAPKSAVAVPEGRAVGSAPARTYAPVSGPVPAAPVLEVRDVAPEADKPFTAPASRPGTVYHITPPAPAAVPEPVPAPEPEPEPAQQTIELPDAPAREEAPWRIAGEVLKTYIICEDGDGAVWLIDKHAAHERVRFDALKASPVPPMAQQLLTPAAVNLDGEAYSAVLDNLPLLERCGFQCEDFGGGTVLVRALPDDVPAAEAASTLEELAQKLLLQRADPEGLRDDLLHTIACKSAIKAGMTSDVTELAALVRRVQSGEIRYCPHGRPVAAKLTRYELEKMFKRA
ncbi:MAG: DNA mismatch repair endonuclease MutL [Clostridiales bacterium]|nr:DNA mismatch repair endonuclease MutL [Clostridiales bacterium]